MALSYDKVIDVISKPSDKRTVFGINNVLPWFRKKSDLFKKLKTDCLCDLIKNLQFVKLNKDNVMIRQGDIGECMYILMRGKVTIYILYNKKEDEEEKEPSQQSTDKKGKESNVRQQLGTFVTSLGAGAVFGEVALISEDCVRTASIITDEQCDVIVIDRQLYNRSVKEVLQKEFEDKQNFVTSNPYFGNWAPRYKKQLTMALQKLAVPYESVLVKQGEPVSGMYFILSGEVKVLMDSTQHKSQYPRLLQDETNPKDAEQPIWDDESTEDIIRSMSERRRESSRRKKKRKCVEELCLLGVNESVGDVEVLFDLPTYVQTIVSTQRTEVLLLEMKHFERLLLKRHPKSIEGMKSSLEIKLKSRHSQLLIRHVPILDILVEMASSYNAQLQYQNQVRTGDFVKPPKDTKLPKKLSEKFDTFIPSRGALVDIYGQGTVFHRIRERDRVRKKKTPTKPSGLYPADVAYDQAAYGARERPQTSSNPEAFPPLGDGMIQRHRDSDPGLTDLESRIRDWLNNDFKSIGSNDLASSSKTVGPGGQILKETRPSSALL